MEKREFSSPDWSLIKNIAKGKANRFEKRLESRRLLELAWNGLTHLEEVLDRCRKTGFQNEHLRALKLLRIAQGIRTDLLEALVLTEKGFYSSVSPILRSSIENAAAMIAITQKEALFEKLDNGTLILSKCISVATNIFPDTGRRYGILTMVGVHQKKISLGLNIKPKAWRSHELLEVPEHNSFNGVFAPICTESVLFICHMTYFTLEFAFESRLSSTKQIQKHGEEWRSVENGPITSLSSEHGKVVRRFKILRRILAFKMILFRQ